MASESEMHSYTQTGHVVGMLDRDQRTTKTWYLSCNNPCIHVTRTIHLNTHVCCERARIRTREPSHGSSWCLPSIRRRGSLFQRSRTGRYYLRNAVQKLKQILVLGIYLISFVTFPSSLTAPTRNQMADRMQSPPKWINPCGIGVDNGSLLDMNAELPRISDSDLLTQIVAQAKIACSKADQFKDEYTQKTFNQENFKKFHDMWKSSHYDWLPGWNQIPKNLFEEVPQGHLASLEIDKILLDTYEYLQKISVGLEQVVWDQEDEQGQFTENFTQSEYNLRLLLCEIQMAIYERGLPMRNNVTRDVMPDEYRNMEAGSSRNLRDFLIYRDYMNSLEYTIQVFDFIKSNL